MQIRQKEGKNGYILDFVKKGREAEEKFAQMFCDYIMSSEEEDKKEHWDFQISHKYDHKSVKNLRRELKETNENIHWIELINSSGKLGWLYAEKPELFVFETNNYWIVVEKLRLQELMNEKVVKNYLETPEFYQIYLRRDKEGNLKTDQIVLVPTLDLIYICQEMIKKPKNYIEKD